MQKLKENIDPGFRRHPPLSDAGPHRGEWAFQDIYIYIYIYAYTHIHISTYTCVYIYIYISPFVADGRPSAVAGCEPGAVPRCRPGDYREEPKGGLKGGLWIRHVFPKVHLGSS